jgi:hypothetical protein
MRRVFTPFLIVLATALLIPACNLPVAPSVKTPPSTVLTAGVAAPSECRSGPGEAYGLVAALDLGQAVQVVGRNPEGDYLLVQHPANPGILCWLKLASVAVIGNFQDLPVVSVPAPASTLIVGCPTPVGGGPSPVVCPVPIIAGCPSPVGGGPTPVACSVPTVVGCPSPVGGGPTPVVCTAPGVPALAVGCPSPVGGGPTPVDCSGGGRLPSVVGCPSPVGGGPTPVDCSAPGGPPSGGGPPTLVPGSKPGREPTSVPAGRPLAPTPVQ